MTAGDRGVIAVVALLALLWLPVTIAAAFVEVDNATITGPGGTTTVALDVDGTYLIEGRSGIVTVRVAGGTVRVAHAECDDSLCERSGAASPGRPVVCAPNGVSVSVYGGGGESLDAVSR